MRGLTIRSPSAQPVPHLEAFPSRGQLARGLPDTDEYEWGPTGYRREGKLSSDRISSSGSREIAVPEMLGCRKECCGGRGGEQPPPKST